MGNTKTTVAQNPGISMNTGPEVHLGPDLGTAEDTEKRPKVEEQQTPEDQLQVDTTEPKTKKSLSFKLAFIGLATSLFVFQVDATCLGIALPVSHKSNLLLNHVIQILKH